MLLLFAVDDDDIEFLRGRVIYFQCCADISDQNQIISPLNTILAD